MSNYIKNVLIKLSYEQGVFPQFSPHESQAIQWSNKGDMQYV